MGELSALLERKVPLALVIEQDAAIVFHLVAPTIDECEVDLDLGMRSNFAVALALLEACRAAKRKAVRDWGASGKILMPSSCQSGKNPMLYDNFPRLDGLDRQTTTFPN
jgi:nucleoside-diphosphate-sugar epimerase